MSRESLWQFLRKLFLGHERAGISFFPPNVNEDICCYECNRSNQPEHEANDDHGSNPEMEGHWILVILLGCLVNHLPKF